MKISAYISNVKIYIALFLLISFTSMNVGFSQRSCGAMDMLAQQIKDNPEYLEKIKAIEKHTRSIINGNSSRNFDGIITIPVVVHVVYNNEGENISDEQVYSQIDVLNEDFRRLNSDTDNIWSQAADTEFEFCLAQTDPYNNATCGITRTPTSVTKFPKDNNPVKFTADGGIDAWPADKYLNIWVCDIDDLLGYAQFPGSGPAATDGVVCDYRSFGTIGDLRPEFALGRTATHEVGHWLNLRHIWGDGDCSEDDFVTDTPLAGNPNYSTSPCTFPGPNSCDEGVNDEYDMFQNYMDYSDDICMNLFTQGQRNRMRALFEPGGERESLLYSQVCSTAPSCSFFRLILNFDNYPEDISWEVYSENSESIIFSGDDYPSELAGQSVHEEMCLEDGEYIFRIKDSFGDGLCCEYGPGNYSLDDGMNYLYLSDGQFTFFEEFGFTYSNGTYTFVGPGADWNSPSNWDKGIVPTTCFDGDLLIADDCQLERALDLNSQSSLTISSGSTFTIQE